MSNRSLLQVMLGGATLLLPALAAAYQVVPVENGGSIVGRATLEGRPRQPPAATFPRNLNPQDRAYCGKKPAIVAPYYRVGRAGGLADVVVWIESIGQGRAPLKKDGVLANKDCRFQPLVQTIDVGARLQVENHDPILHNTHPVYEESKVTAFNIGMPRAGQKLKKKIRQSGIMRVGCDAGHVWMRAWVHAFPHPYHAVTADDGSFSLPQVPPGEYTLKAWHEAAGTLSRKIKVSASSTARADFVFQAR